MLINLPTRYPARIKIGETMIDEGFVTRTKSASNATVLRASFSKALSLLCAAIVRDSVVKKMSDQKKPTTSDKLTPIKKSPPLDTK